MTGPSPYRTADPLGSAMNEHRVAGGQQVVRIVLGLFCLLIAIDCVWLGMWPRFGDIHWGAFIVTGIIALIFFWLAYDAFAQFVKLRRQRVVHHEYGLRIHDSKSHEDVRFDDIASIGGVLWQAPKGAPPAGAVLWFDDVRGRRIELPAPLAKAHDLGQTIRSATFEKRRAEIEARISLGESVRFGRILLSDMMLMIDGDAVPRERYEDVLLSNRWLSLPMPNKRSSRLVPTEEIPNLDILLALLHR